MPDCVSIPAPRGGPYLWFELPEGCDAEEFADLADKRNVFISLGRLYSFGSYAKRCFRVNCCATKNANELVRAAKALGSLLTTYLERKILTG
jgi:DNA-binding transcriptional MocR family regulator